MQFTEEDVRNLQGFLQFIAERGKFELDWAEAIQLARYRQFGTDLLKKVNGHIMELRSVQEAPPEAPSTRGKKSGK